jgi:beta-fructofuranosidase
MHFIPRIKSSWRPLVTLPDRHVNDFCLFRDREGWWHAIGIQGDGTWEGEVSLFHCAGPSLDAPLEERPPLFEPMPQMTGRAPASTRPQKHAPFVVESEGRYHLFYRRPRGAILKVTTTDPFAWPDEAELVFEEADARDVCLVRDRRGWLMYYCQSVEVEGAARSAVLMRESTNLRTWSRPHVALHETSHRAEHSLLESPFVVRRPEGFYCLARARWITDRCTTVVYFGRAPGRFASGDNAWFAELPDVHAAEAVEVDGGYCIARASAYAEAGTSNPPFPGVIEVAELSFEDSWQAE